MPSPLLYSPVLAVSDMAAWWLTGVLVAAVVIGMGWHHRDNLVNFTRYFSRGLDSPEMESRLDRQQKWIDAIFWLVILIPILAMAAFIFSYIY
ncbi:MAG: hypothetical protein AAGK14_14585 [Verrucomicrobiota bacterium]